jgi:hypothetical protein
MDGVEIDTNPVDDFILPSPPRKMSTEEVEREDTYATTKTDRFIEAYVGDAGQGLRKSKMRFKEWLAVQEAEGLKPWELFASRGYQSG